MSPNVTPQEVVPPAIIQEADSDNYIAVKNIISRNLAELDRLTAERKVEKEKLSNIFENDNDVSEAQEEVIRVQRELKQRKSQIMATPQAATINLKIKEQNEEIKELQESLSTHLQTYRQITGTSTFEDSDGTEREFKVKASIKPKQLSLF